MTGESSPENAELSGDESLPQTEEREMWIKRLWSWLFGHPKTMDPLRDSCKMTRSEFELILRERKSELLEVKLRPVVISKAEQRRRKGLKKRNGKVNSKSGLGPLDLLPEDIWIQVLNKLTPKDRLNMCHVHRGFRDMLKSNLIRDTLLPYVLEQKVRFKMTPDHFSHYVYLYNVHRQPGPYYTCPGMKDLKQLMNIRLVSKSLRDAMDKWFEERLLYVMRIPRARDEPNALNSVNLNLWENGREMLEAGRPHRFFLRSLTVNFSPYIYRFRNETGNLNVRVRNLKEILDELLEKVGEQLLHFHVYIEHFHLASAGDYLSAWRSLEEVGNIIRAWLLEMPNLKWLVIESADLGVSGVLNEAMPRLDNLERFDVDGADLIPIANAIISANPHIKIHSRFPAYHNDAIQYLTSPTLALPLEWVHIGCNQRPCADLVLPQAIPDNNWNLKSMELCMMGSWEETIIHSMDSIFSFIQKFPSLEDVSLRIDCVKIGDKINFLRLPNLKHFCIEFGPTVEYSGECTFFFSLQFLLHCKKLRSLVWDNKIHDLRPIRNLMKSVGGNEGIWMDLTEEHPNDFYESNLWDVFPHLRTIHVCYMQTETGGYSCIHCRPHKAIDCNDERWSIFWVVVAIISLFFF